MDRRLAVVLVLLLGCGDDPAACTARTNTVDVIAGSPFEQVARGLLADLQDQGWDCSDATMLRDGAGTAIGTRYRCTTCD